MLAAWAEVLTAASSSSALQFEQTLGIGPSMRVLERQAALLSNPQSMAALAPRVASVWIDAGLAQEREGRLAQAEASLLHAARIDKHFAPAWTLTNFYFRRSDHPHFWHWAKVASRLVYDDFRPLLRLCDVFEQDPSSLLIRLGATDGRLERAYLDFLIGSGRTEAADQMAGILLAAHREMDRPRLLDWASREIAAGRWRGALKIWSALERPLDPEHGPFLSNADFAQHPSGIGFDWTLRSHQARWTPGQIVFDFSGTDEELTLLEQTFPIQAGHTYNLSASLHSEGPVAGNFPEWELNGKAGPLRATRTGLANARLVYRRKPGTVPLHGTILLGKISQEIL